ncbi:glycosyltransferase family 2 protein [Arthrobacter sp. Soil782]|uniref:glycosyltransferase family 2 protein n=1 Tax=Arthrobacter sp. Soil782 TaxID=1736410 RepID=UPI0009E6DC52|nr:glycosyltransferase family 2 protein [Arthrobacter sp. Soil782]
MPTALAREHAVTVPRAKKTRVIALIPAHNEEELIIQAVQGLLQQTYRPNEIIVVADNCTDRTVELLRDAQLPSVSVFETTGNSAKKAGALNQALAELLPELSDDDTVLVQDADSILDAGFISSAQRHIKADPTLGAVGGTFRAVRAEPGAPRSERFLIHLQDNEYARYARDVRRLKGKCLVVTGTAAMFRTSTLRRISQARLRGELPAGDGSGGIYDTTVLTEDNELSFAVMTVGMKLLAPRDCLLVTDAMKTCRELWLQRLRWKRGAVENCFQYGFTRVTAGYWGRQLLSLAGILVTLAYLGSLIWSLIAIGSISIHPFWLAITGIFVLERFVTLKDKGWSHRILATTLYELPYDFFLQIVHARAYFDVMRRSERKW